MKWKKYVKSICGISIYHSGNCSRDFSWYKIYEIFYALCDWMADCPDCKSSGKDAGTPAEIARKHTSMFLIIGVLAAIVGGLYLIGVKTIEETRLLIEQAPAMYEGIREDFQVAGENLSMIIEEFPESVQDSLQEFQDNVGTLAGKAVSKISQITVDQAGAIAKNLPSILIAIIFTILSAYFFIADRDKILEFGRANTPKVIQEHWRMLTDSLKKVFGGYFKAQFKIMGVIGVIIFIGLMILHVKFAAVFAVLIALLDMLPFFGTGTAFVPWALFKIISGDVQYAVGLIILYLITQLVRRIIEPKVVGDTIGINPLLTLVFMYAGYQFSGVLGMILAVPVGAIAINFYKAGVFDGPLNGIREAINDLLKWMYSSEDETEHKGE